MARRAPDAEDRRKSRRGQQVTAIGSAHKKEPPLGLEPRTYALRKRLDDDVTGETAETYDDAETSVAPQVATQSVDAGCDEMMIPDDLSEVIRLWPMLQNEIRRAVLALVRTARQ